MQDQLLRDCQWILSPNSTWIAHLYLTKFNGTDPGSCPAWLLLLEALPPGKMKISLAGSLAGILQQVQQVSMHFGIA